jgi:hypothetical protein
MRSGLIDINKIKRNPERFVRVGYDPRLIFYAYYLPEGRKTTGLLQRFDLYVDNTAASRFTFPAKQPPPANEPNSRKGQATGSLRF